MLGTIYFIEAIGGNAVKIGFTSETCKKRMFHLQCGNHCELRLLAAFDGLLREETELHKRFAHLRIRREWFEMTDELLAYIATIPAPVPEATWMTA